MDRLPPELLEDIFELVQDHREICGLRFLNRQIATVGKPYLVRRLVFAKRVPALRKVVEVLEQPEYHKHLREVVFDLSQCIKYLNIERPCGWPQFRKAYESFSHLVPSICNPSLPPLSELATIRDYCASKSPSTAVRQQDNTTLRKKDIYPIRRFFASEVRFDRGLTCSPYGCEDYHADCDYDRENFYDQQRELIDFPQVISVDAGRTPPFLDHRPMLLPEIEELATDPVELSARDAFALQLGYIDLERAIERMNLVGRLLTIAQKKLPKLTKLIITDFRGLARDGESYQDVRRRLFTNPAIGSHTPVIHEATNYIYDALRMWAQEGTLESLTIGLHMFSSSTARPDDLGGEFAETSLRQPLMADLWRVLWREDGWYSPLIGMGDRFRLRDLHLDLRDMSSSCPTALPQLGRMLNATQDTLRRLYVSADLIKKSSRDPFFGYGLGMLPQQYHPHGIAKRLDVFEQTLLPLRLPHLQSLTLTDWLLDIHQLHSFLSAHASTLSYLHLLTCMLFVPEHQHHSLLDFADWVGDIMRLRGMEAFDLRYRQQAMVRLHGRFARLAAVPSEHLPKDCGGWDREFESRCLGGRRNEAVAQGRPRVGLRPGEGWGEVGYYW